MSVQRTLGAVALVGALVITACASGSDDAALPTTTRPAPASTTAGTDSRSSEPTPDPVDYEELELAEGPAAELTLALSEFAYLFDVDVPGAVPLVADDSIPTLATDAVATLEARRDELTDDQRRVIDATNDAIISESTVVYRTADDAAYQALVAETRDAATTSEPDGLRRARPQGVAASAVVRQVDLSAAEAIAGATAIDLFRRLGGPAIDWELRIGTPAEADTPTTDASTYSSESGDACLVIVFDWLHLTGAYLKSVVAHEVFHCWQAARRAGAPMVDFYREGLATWVGEDLAGGSGFGDKWWPAFFDTEPFPLYRAKYRALGFWAQVAQLRGGSDGLWEIIPELTDAASSAAGVWNAALDGVDGELVATLAATGALRPDWSAAWDLPAARIAGPGRAVRRVALAPTEPATIEADAGEQALGAFDLGALPADISWVLNLDTAGFARLRWGSGEEFSTTSATSTQFCYGGSCACPDGTVPLPSISFVPLGETSLTVGVTGPAAGNSFVTVTPRNIEEFCDDDPLPTPPPLSSGAFSGNGTWRASNPSLAAMFTDASAIGFGAVPLDIAGVTGDVVMELRPDGTGTLTYTDVTAFINNGPMTDLTINGTGDFAFGVAAGELTVSGNTFMVSVTSSALLGETLVITDADLEGGAGGTSTYTVGFDGDQMVLTGSRGSNGALSPAPPPAAGPPRLRRRDARVQQRRGGGFPIVTWTRI